MIFEYFKTFDNITITITITITVTVTVTVTVTITITITVTITITITTPFITSIVRFDSCDSTTRGWSQTHMWWC